MPAAALPSPTLLAALAPPPDLLLDLLAVSLTGVIVYEPIYDAAGALVDFRFVYLNPAAQRMMTMPAYPTVTHRQQWPQSEAHGTLAFHIEAYETGEPRHYEVNYQADGYDNYYRLAARRSGRALLVSFTDTADQPRTAVEIALRESQVRERAALAAVEHQRAELQRLFEQAPVGMTVVKGPRYVVQLVNPELLRIWGRTAQQALQTPLFEVLPEAAGQGFEPLLDEVMATGIPFVTNELPSFIDREGRRDTVYWNFIYHPLREADGRVSGVTIVATEVTAQVVARQQLEELNQTLETRVRERTEEVQLAQAATEVQRQRLHRLIAEAPALIARLRGPDHVMELVNDRFRQLFHGRDLLGRPYREALPELDGQPFFGLLDAVYRTGETYYGTEEPARLDPTNSGRLDTLYFDYTYQATRDADGQIDGILIFATEVTERVRARQERETQRQRLHDLFMQAPAAICILDGPALVYELVNPGYQALFPGRLLQGRPLLDALPEIAGHAVYRTFREVYETGVTHEELGNCVPLTHPTTGQLEDRYFNYIQQARFDEQGRPDGVLVFAFEVTEQVRASQQAQALADELAATNAQLTRTNVNLDNFIYTASHDLVAPITNIDGLIEVLADELPLPIRQAPEVAPVLTMMQDAVARFQRTIHHLSDVTRLQKENDQFPTEVAVAPVLDDVCHDLAPLLTATDAHLIVDLDACPTVAFSVKNLRSVLYNLLSNALKYRHPDRPPVVHLSCQRAADDAGHVVLRVQDNGLGLSATQQAQLFTMFRRLHPQVAGSGIGLYMVKRSIENVGGRVAVASEPGVGSTFSVYLPR